jgi:fluoroquinolone transport system permease protein
MLATAAVGPLVLAVVIRVGAPFVAELAAPTVELEAFYPVLAGSMTAFGPAIYGFVVGTFVLEDREQGMLTAYRTSPLSPRDYLLYRGGTAYALSLAATLPALAVIGLVPASPALAVGSAAVGALGGPAIALIFGTLASNTIEGIALSKLVNLLVLGPAVAVAVVPEPVQFAAGVVPTFWPVKAYATGVAGQPTWPTYLLAGVVTHLLGIAVLGRWFARRAD